MPDSGVQNQQAMLGAALQQQFPVAFPSHGRQALAVGIKQQIAAAFPSVPDFVLESFLQRWTRGWNYRSALAQQGAVRVNLDGTPQGPVDVRHRQRAIMQLARSKARKQRSPEGGSAQSHRRAGR